MIFTAVFYEILTFNTEAHLGTHVDYDAAQRPVLGMKFRIYRKRLVFMINKVIEYHKKLVGVVKEGFPGIKEKEQIDGLDYTFSIQLDAKADWKCTFCQNTGEGWEASCGYCGKKRPNYGCTKEILNAYKKMD